MFPCEMARYIAVFSGEARKYGPFGGRRAGKSSGLRHEASDWSPIAQARIDALALNFEEIADERSRQSDPDSSLTGASSALRNVRRAFLGGSRWSWPWRRRRRWTRYLGCRPRRRGWRGRPRRRRRWRPRRELRSRMWRWRRWRSPAWGFFKSSDRWGRLRGRCHGLGGRRQWRDFPSAALGFRNDTFCFRDGRHSAGFGLTHDGYLRIGARGFRAACSSGTSRSRRRRRRWRRRRRFAFRRKLRIRAGGSSRWNVR